MKRLVFAAFSAAAVYAGQNSLEIYQNAAFLRQNLEGQKSEFSLNLPFDADENEIDVSASCELENLTLNKEEIARDKDFEDFKAQNSELKNLEARRDALMQKKDFLAKFSPAAKIGELESESEKFYEIALKNLREINAQNALIDDFTQKMPYEKLRAFRRLDLKFSCEPKNAGVSYPADFAPRFESAVDADVAAGKIKITQSLNVTNPLNADLKNLDIFLYPFAYSSALAPSPFYPIYDGGERKEKAASFEAYSATKDAIDNRAVKKSLKFAVADAQNFEGAIWRAWQIMGVNLKAYENKSFKFDEQSLDAKFDVLIDGYASASAFTRAKFTPERGVQSARAKIFIGGANRGATNFSAAAGEENTAYFGKNSLISVKKTRVKNFSKDSFFSSKTSSLQAYEYEIKNGSKQAQNVELVERVPVSSHEKVSVKMQNSPKETSVSELGEVSWKFALAPGESKKVTFFYEISK